MKLISKHRQQQGHKLSPRIAISEAEITADLLYPAATRRRVETTDRAARGSGARR